MEPNLQPSQPRTPFRGPAGLIVAVAVVVIVLIAFPAYRWFFLDQRGNRRCGSGYSLPWHKLKPIREEDIENKRPLGLG